MTKEEQLLEQKKRIEQELADIKKKAAKKKRDEEKFCRNVFGASKEEVALRLEKGEKATSLIERYLKAAGCNEITLERFEGYVRGKEQKAENQ